MKTKISLVVFTHKRALQLDCLILSAITNFDNLALPIEVIYHKNNSHHKSYLKLFNKWQDKIKVYYRVKNNKDFSLITLIRPLNLLWFLKFQWNRIFYDNFKNILENIISNSSSKFIILSTDDQVFYKITNIPDFIFELIKLNPTKSTYRISSSIHFNDIHKPNDIDKKLLTTQFNKFSYLSWFANKIKTDNYWSYRFHVDGVIYEKNSLLSFLKPFIYNMPTTLEGAGLWESRFRGYFNDCMGSYSRSYIGIQASNIQNISNTPSALFDLDIMRDLYLNNFCINFKLFDIDETKYIFVPKIIPLIKNNKNFILKENGKID